MPRPPPRSARSPCRSAACACTSAGLGQSCGAERCGRRCRGSCRPRGRLHPLWPQGATFAAAARTPCGWAGSQSAKPVSPRSVCFLSWSRADSPHPSVSGRRGARQAAAR
eukprot:4980879-Pleurochrysis_carterae.AAC.3